MIALFAALALSATGSASAELEARAGYDSNLFYESVDGLADPSARAAAADGYLALLPRLAAEGELGRGRLGVRYEPRYVQYASLAHGYLLLHELAVEGGVRAGPATWGAHLLGDDYTISAFRSDRLRRGLAGLDAEAVAGRLRLKATAEGGARLFPLRQLDSGAAEVDQLLGGALAAELTLGTWSLAAWGRAERQWSNAPVLSGDREELALSARLARGRLTALLIVEGRRLSLPDFPLAEGGAGRLDQQLWARAEVGWGLGAFEPFLHAAWESAGSNYIPAVFRRYEAGLGLRVRWAYAPGPALPRTPLPLPEHPGAYRFEVDLSGAHDVRLTGTFTGWSREGLPLREERPGHWTAEVDLPPGRYRYQLVIDGERRAPPEAQAYEPDGLGGLDGVLVVPGAASVAGDGR